MAFTRYQIFLSILLVATGSINTLSTKWADHLQAIGSDGKYRHFDHPLVQSCFMFLGEFFCLFTFHALHYYYTKKQIVIEHVNYIRGSQNFSRYIFAPAAMFDMIATSMMYVGLVLTYASSFQMLRGSSIVFVALLSTTFVGRELKSRHWYGIGLIVIGLCIVGLSDLSSISDDKDTNSIITGDLLIIIAQIIAACQIVYEEKFVVDKDVPPLQAVGLEGAFGLLVLGFLLFPSYYIIVGPPFATNSRGALEDLPDALTQMYNNYWIIVASLGTMVSIAFFNFAGISMTKEVSATTRIVLDSVRTFFIWMFSVAVGWQSFYWLQLLGFSLLFCGMCVYYNILPPFPTRRQVVRFSSEDPIVNQQADQP